MSLSGNHPGPLGNFGKLMSEKCDFLIIGGGVIGITIAIELSKKYPSSKIIILEKEQKPGMHASGRNSGVLHAGFYYTADSLKARFTRDGNKAWHNFCDENSIPVNRCGKLVVAKDEQDDKVMDTLIERGNKNGITLELLNVDEAKKIEPRVTTYRRALFSPTTSTVDPNQIMEALVYKAQDKGILFKCGCAYKSFDKSIVKTSHGKISAKFVVNAAGLYADKIAHDFDFGHQYYLLPFKGVYLYSSSSAPALSTNIYPVPDLNNPFLGVHFTQTVDGKMKLGPSAIPALWPEQYDWHSNFHLNEFFNTSGRHLQLVLGSDDAFRRLAIEEIKKYSLKYMVKQAQRLAEGVKQKHFNNWGKPGIRAQLVNRKTKKLEMDFILEGDDKSMHILNAVSPAFTCALPFAEYVVERINAKLN